ncbi:MAG: mechanosensitive ion channel family protein [Chloroflexi bacterium]|nr:mechanosensitive ion channel family protein [Chloroflexota bacterium]
MKLRFNICLHASVVICAGWLLWPVGTMAQTGPAGANPAPAAIEKSTPGAGQAGPAKASSVRNENEAWLTFGLDRIEALQQPVLGNPLWQYVASAIYILLAFLLSKLLDFLVGARLTKWAKKTKTDLDDILLDLIHGPIKIVSFVLLLHIGLQVFDWPEWLESWLRTGLQLVVACSLTYLVLKLIDLLMAHWQQREESTGDRSLDEQLFPIVRKSLKVFVLVVAILLTSQNLGLNVTSVIASLSIGGLALGLAAQDTLANLFGAVSVFIDKPFRLGDRIKLDSVDGVVEAIGLRSTRVRNLEGHLITIPNKTMGNATITNVTRRPNIKTEMKIGLTYDTSTAKMRQALALLEEIYRQHPMTQDLIVSFNVFADSSLNILVVHWWGSTDYRAYLAGMQELNLTIKQRFEEAGIDMAYPTQTLYLKQDSEWQLRSPPGALPASR